MRRAKQHETGFFPEAPHIVPSSGGLLIAATLFRKDLKRIGVRSVGRFEAAICKAASQSGGPVAKMKHWHPVFIFSH